MRRVWPIILYPYAYLLAVGLLLCVVRLLLPRMSENMGLYLGCGTLILLLLACAACTLTAYICAIRFSIATYQGEYDLPTACRTVMQIKLFQIPAYLLNFVLFLSGILLSVWGIGLMLAVAVVDLLTIVASGIASVGCILRMRHVYQSNRYVFGGIGMFVYCIDVPIAIYFYVKQIRSK